MIVPAGAPVMRRARADCCGVTWPARNERERCAASRTCTRMRGTPLSSASRPAIVMFSTPRPLRRTEAAQIARAGKCGCCGCQHEHVATDSAVTRRELSRAQPIACNSIVSSPSRTPAHRSLSRAPGHQSPLRLADPQGAPRQHARLRRHRSRAAEPGARHARGVRSPGRDAARARDGADRRHRPESPRRDGRRQRLVARRAGERAGGAAALALRHRLAAESRLDARSHPGARAGRALRHGARARRAAARVRCRGAAASRCAITSIASRSIRASIRASSSARSRSQTAARVRRSASRAISKAC